MTLLTAYFAQRTPRVHAGSNERKVQGCVLNAGSDGYVTLSAVTVEQ